MKKPIWLIGIFVLLLVGFGLAMLLIRSGATQEWTFRAYSDELGVADLAFIPEGNTLAVVGGDRLVALWDVATRKQKGTLEGHSERVRGVALSADGQVLIAMAGETIKVWNLRDGKETATLLGHKGGVTCIAISPDGTAAASGGNDFRVRLWDLATGKEKFALKHRNAPGCVAFSPDGKTLASAGFIAEPVKLCDSDTGEEVGRLLEGDDLDWRVQSIAFSPDGNLLAIGDGRRTGAALHLWDGNTLKPVAKHPVREIGPIVFHPNGKMLAWAEAGKVKLWDVRTRTESASFRSSGYVYAVAFSPDGKVLAFAGKSPIVRQRDVSEFVK